MYSFSELRRVFAEGNAGLKQNVRDFGLNEIEDVHLESIVEVIGQLNYQFDPNKEKHRNSISLGLESLRVAESVNIEKWFERTVPGTEIKRGEHATTYLLPEKITRMVLNQIMPTPDRATLVEIPSKRILGTGITADVAAEYASGKKQWESPFAKCGTWRDTCLVGVVVDQNLQKIVERIPDDEPSAAAKPILRCIEHGTAFIGLECARPDDRLKMVRAEVRLTAINDELAETLETQLSTLLSLGRSLLQPPEQTKENAAPSDSIEMQRAVLALLQAAKIKRTGKEIVIQAATQVELDRIVPRVETAAKPANLK